MADIYETAALDVTVILTLQQLTLVGATSTMGHSLEVEEERKIAAQAEACRAVEILLFPLL